VNRERRYRTWHARNGLVPFTVHVKETDLYILARTVLDGQAQEAVLHVRHTLETYIRQHPWFKEALTPIPEDSKAPGVIREMIAAAHKTGVGPMAGVAGAVAQFVGRRLLSVSPDVVVENGGDIFLQTASERVISIFAGYSPLSMKVGVRIPDERMPVGVCTSSGTVGHSLSFGRADAVCVISPDTTLADATATAVTNMIHSASDIDRALAWGRQIPGVDGIVVIIGESMGVWGAYELMSLHGTWNSGDAPPVGRTTAARYTGN